MSLPPAILELSARAPELCDRLITWANQNSGSDHEAGLQAMHDLLAEDFRRIGQVESIPLPGTSARALRVRFRPHAPRQILFSGHYDTVYGREDSFQTCERINPHTLRGPGVSDMKGGLVIMHAALDAFQSSPHAEQIGGQVLLTPDEETGSVASRACIEASAAHHAFGLVFEPARENGDLVRARMGTGIFRVTCRGRAAHAGRSPESGRNAILALAEYLPRAAAINQEFSGVLLNVGRISGGGAVNIVPDFARADLNLRIANKTDAESVISRLHELAQPINQREGYSLAIDGSFNRMPKEITAIDERLFSGWQETAERLGLRIGWQDVGGGSDGNLLAAAGLPTLDGLGVAGGGMHSPREYAHLPSLVTRAQITALFLHRLATQDLDM